MNKMSQLLLCLMSAYTAGALATQPLCLVSVEATPSAPRTNNGTVTATWVNGTPPFTVSFPGTAIPTQTGITGHTAMVTGLAAGTIVEVVVTDSSTPPQVSPSTGVDRVLVGGTNVDGIVILNVSISQVAAGCGLANGSLMVTVTSGTAPFTATINTTPAQTQTNNTTGVFTFTDLAGGNFSVTVTDNAGRTFTTSMTVCNFPGITSSTNPILNFIIQKFCKGCFLEN